MVLLADAQKLTQDKLAKQVINEFRKDQLLDAVPFDDTASMGGGGTLAYVYNRVTTLSSAGFRALNSEYIAQEAVTTQHTANLKVFGGSFQVDRVIQDNVKGVTNQVAFQLQSKIEATRALFSDTFINGDSATNSNAFDGIDKAITGSSTEINPASAIDISTSANLDTNWKAFLDCLRKMQAKLDKKPSMWLCNRDLFATIQSIADRATSFTATKNEFGQEVLYWGGVPIVELGDKAGTSNSIIPTDGTAGTTSMYAVRFGFDGVHGISPSGSPVIKSYLPDMNLPGAVKTGEVEMVAAVALKATRAAGVLRNIKIA